MCKGSSPDVQQIPSAIPYEIVKLFVIEMFRYTSYIPQQKLLQLDITIITAFYAGKHCKSVIAINLPFDYYQRQKTKKTI